MEKKFYFLMIFAFLFIIAGGIFLWPEASKEVRDSLPAVSFESSENFVFNETPEGIIVENQSAGISFKVPEGWAVNKEEIITDQWIVNVESPDIEADEYGFLKKGCGISSWIEYDKIMADAVRYRMEDPERHSGEVSGGYEALEVSGHPALKMILENPEWGQSVAIKIPIEDKIYMFDTMFLPEEMERCSKAFEQFLQEISIF